MNKKQWEEQFCKIYQDTPPAVLAMMIVDIDDLLKAERQEIIEKIENLKFTDPTDKNKTIDIIKDVWELIKPDIINSLK